MHLEHIKNLSHLEKKSLLERLAKLMEESGELAQEILISLKSPGMSHKDAGLDGIKGECVDVIIVALSIFFKSGGDEEELNALFKKKCEKWAYHQNDTQKNLL